MIKEKKRYRNFLYLFPVLTKGNKLISKPSPFRPFN